MRRRWSCSQLLLQSPATPRAAIPAQAPGCHVRGDFFICGGARATRQNPSGANAAVAEKRATSATQKDMSVVLLASNNVTSPFVYSSTRLLFNYKLCHELESTASRAACAVSPASNPTSAHHSYPILNDVVYLMQHVESQNEHPQKRNAASNLGTNREMFNRNSSPAWPQYSPNRAGRLGHHRYELCDCIGPHLWRGLRRV